MYADEQDEDKERGDSRQDGGAAINPQGTDRLVRHWALSGMQ